jgi:putative transposase
MRYKFIREHRQEFSIKRMCQLLDVTRSGYYAWQPEKAGPRELEDRVLVEQIHTEYKLSRRTYGSPRIQTSLLRQGVTCGRNRVARLMRKERRDLPSETTQMASCDHPASAGCAPSA